MANTTQEEIYRSFLEASQQHTADLAETRQSLADLILQADATRQDIAQQTARTASSTASSSGSARGGVSRAGDTDGSVLDTVFDAFQSGLIVSPLVRGIMSLFGGDDPPAPAPLVKYALPPQINFQAAETGGRITSLDYDQAGMPRGYGSGASSNGSPAGAASQITVNVQAMDARSFLDRSNDIALAVRDAMLNMNAINDVVNDL